MTVKIELTIHEIVCDFEKLIRRHERLGALFDFEKADDDEIERFHTEMVELMEKYLPTYREHLSDEYLNEDTPTFDRALELYGELYRNFKEMFYQMI